jgi:hypothetical protein
MKEMELTDENIDKMAKAIQIDKKEKTFQSRLARLALDQNGIIIDGQKNNPEDEAKLC